MSSADHDNHTPYPIKKKFCKVCGAKLQDVVKTVGYNEFDGAPIFLRVEGVCSDLDKHKRAKTLYGEDLND